ncbi:hypothetical protein NC651_002228 [Populus alba x Populus x berolinensis]|nr:hypothetical protein NC651_002228 [Populus alba x Populus x berolinensis]
MVRRYLRWKSKAERFGLLCFLYFYVAALEMERSRRFES